MLLFFSLSSTYLFSKTKHTQYVCMLFCIAVSDSLGIALNSANCATITCLLPSSVQLHHNLFIFWVKKPSSQANAVSCKKKQPRLSSWHSPDIFLARRKPFIHLRLGRGGSKDLHCLVTQKTQQSRKIFYPPASEIRRQSGTVPLLLLY